MRPLVPTDMPQHSCWAGVGHHGPQAKEGVVPAPVASPPAAPLGLPPPGREGRGSPAYRVILCTTRHCRGFAAALALPYQSNKVVIVTLFL